MAVSFKRGNRQREKLDTKNAHIFPGFNRVFITGSNLLRSVARTSTTECLVCEADPVSVALTFASTSSEYIVLTSSRLDGYSYWESRCSGKLIAECVDMCENITKQKVQSVKKVYFNAFGKS